MNIEFQIKGNPKAKERPRLAFKNGKVFRYTPKATRLYEKEVKKIYKRDIGKYFDEDIPLSVSIITFQEKPKRKRNYGTYSLLKPDLDNCAKLILDALNKVAYKDDSQVAHLECTKLYTDGDPHISIKISELEELKSETI